MSRFVGCGMVIWLLVASGGEAFAQRDLKDTPDPDPELQLRSFQVAEGFEVNLFAADPRIAKPIQMNFDPQGRLWIVSSEVYPHIKPGQKADDKVLILEDTTGDGTADETTVFADGLLIPTGIEPGDGGVYVANSTELVHLSDTTGDGKADTRRTVLSGFGTEDTHHLLHTLRWGPEGLLYMNQSIYIHSHIETPYGVRRLNGGGIWQFRPETLRLDVFARGLINSWGHQLDDYGQSFATDGAGGEGINFIVPGAAYPTAVGVPRILHGLNPGSPKYCGMEFVGGRHLPDDWQGNILTNDFRGHRVCRFVLSEDGSGFAARQMPDLIRSTHVAFRPIDVKLGPDGAIYIADWYNPIIQHGEVDFRDPRRDQTRGRIWRVTYKDRPLVERPKLADAPTGELLDHLKSPEPWTRHNAKRVFKERALGISPPSQGGAGGGEAKTAASDPEAVRATPPNPPLVRGGEADGLAGELREWLKSLDPADPLIERQRLEGLWVFQAIDQVEPELLEALFRSDDHRVRGAATRVLAHWHDRLPNSLNLLAEQVADEHPRVRLEAVRTLGNMAGPRAVEIAMRALDHSTDRFLDYALWLTARELQPLWLPRLQAGEMNFGGRTRHLTFALEAVGSQDVVPALVRLLQSGRVDEANLVNVLQLIASLGTADDMRLVFDLALSDTTPAPRAALLLDSLAEATRRRNVRPVGDLAKIGRLLDTDDPAIQAIAARCAGLWKVEPLGGRLVALAHSNDMGLSVRQAAVAALGCLEGGESREALHKLAGEGFPEEVRTAAITALAAVDLNTAADAAVRLLAGLTPQDDPAPILTAFLQRREGPAVLASRLVGKRLPEDIAKLGLRTIDASGQKESALADALTKAGGVTTGPKSLSPDELQSLIAEVAERGDPHRGERIFRRDGLSCLKCHAVGGAGGRVGPDLLSLGTGSQIDYLIESLLLPDKATKEGYHTLVVVTDQGQVHAGIKVRETDRDLVLRDADDREIAVPLDSIEEQAPGASLMPAGLTDRLTRNELVDLVRFLSALGKDEAFSVGTARVVRTWRTLQPTEEARFRLRRTGDTAAVGDDPAFTWTPAYGTVAGVLPLQDLPEFRTSGRAAQGDGTVTPLGDRTTAFVRFRLDVTTPGPVLLRFNSTAGLRVWLGGEPLDAAPETLLELPAGEHGFTIAVDLAAREEGLRIELADAPDSSAQTRIVHGK